MKFALLIAGLIAGCAAARKPDPPPPMQPEAAVVTHEAPPREAGIPAPAQSPCQLACARMQELGCLGSATTPGGRSCDETFCSVKGAWNYDCMRRADSCAAVDRCNP